MKKKKLSFEYLVEFRVIVVTRLVVVISVMRCDLCHLILTLETAHTKSPLTQSVAIDRTI